MPYAYGVAITSRLDPIHAGATDFRSRDFTPDLDQWSDTILPGSASLTIARCDQVAMGVGDLQMTGVPTVDGSQLGVVFGLAAPLAAAGISYKTTLRVQTVQDRTLVLDAFIDVLAVYG